MGIYHGTGQPNFDFYQKHLANVSATGVLVDETNDGLASIRYQIVGAGLSNVTVLEAQLEATAPWVPITSLAGNGTIIGNTVGYARYRIRTSTYGGSPFAITYRASNQTSSNQVSLVDADGDELEINPDGSINAAFTIAPTSPVIDSLAVTLANTEYSYALPADTVKFSLKIRGYTSSFRISFSAGGTLANYVSIPRGLSFHESEVKTAATIYISCPVAAQTLEILAWTI